MRWTNLLLCALIAVVSASALATIAVVIKNHQQKREILVQQAEISALGQALGETRFEQHKYFEALGHEVGLLREEQLLQWPRIQANLRDLDAASVGLRNNITAIAAALDVKHSPAGIDIGALDNGDELDQDREGFRDTSDRRRVPCHADKSTAVIVTLGQSNAANYALMRYTPKLTVLNFDLYDGRCYEAKDPLLGASGSGGNFASPLGDMLIERGLYTRVIIAPIAIGGSTVEQWADEGAFNRRILVLLRRLFDAGLTPTAILWHQGEANAGGTDMLAGQYRKNLLEVIATFRRYQVAAPFFVALATKCGLNLGSDSHNIREGQATTVNRLDNVWPGPDTDRLGDEYRDKQHCHFNERGLLRHAAMWADAVQAWAASKKLADGEATAH